MKRGLEAESPKASRSLLAAVFRLRSKSTKVILRPELFLEVVSGDDFALPFD